MKKKVLFTILSVLPGGFAILALLVLFSACSAIHGGYAKMEYKSPSLALKSGETYDPASLIWTSARAEACRKRPDLCLTGGMGYSGYYYSPMQEFEGGAWMAGGLAPTANKASKSSQLQGLVTDLREIKLRVKGISDAQDTFFKKLTTPRR